MDDGWLMIFLCFDALDLHVYSSACTGRPTGTNVVVLLFVVFDT